MTKAKIIFSPTVDGYIHTGFTVQTKNGEVHYSWYEEDGYYMRDDVDDVACSYFCAEQRVKAHPDKIKWD